MTQPDPELREHPRQGSDAPAPKPAGNRRAARQIVGLNVVMFVLAVGGYFLVPDRADTVDTRGWWVAVFVLVTSTIGSFQLFELPYIMLNNSAGPDNAGLTIVMYLYNNGFVTGDLGYASAVGWTLALGMLVISLAQMRLTGAWKGGAE